MFGYHTPAPCVTLQQSCWKRVQVTAPTLSSHAVCCQEKRKRGNLDEGFADASAREHVQAERE